MKNSEKTLDMIVNLCKNRGYVYAGSEIYGGLANSWDYGPLGVEFKNNVKKAWLKKFVQESDYNVGLDAAILMNPTTWVTTGHVGSFSDPLVDCKGCGARHRADKLIEAAESGKSVNVDAMKPAEMNDFIAEHEDVVCPNCGKHHFTSIRNFNLMFQTKIGVTEDSSSVCYLRPETAQGIFVNFANIQRTTRKKLPFGVCQVGKAFRNEITPGNFTFRTREFEQMECEFFCQPGTDLEWFAYWKDFCKNWLVSLVSRRRACACVTMSLQSWPSIPVLPPISSISSPSAPAGASCGALPTVPTMTWAAIRRPPARAWSTTIRSATSITFPT